MFKNLKFIARRNYSLFLKGESETGKSSAWDCVFACDCIWPYDPQNGNYSEWLMLFETCHILLPHRWNY